MALPSNISYGTVVGQFLASIQDGPDPDKLPEGVPMKGTVTFIASPTYVLDYTAIPNPVTILKTPIVCPLDSEGYVCSPYYASDTPMSRGVYLIATNDPDILPVGWTWTVMYSLTDPTGRAVSLPNQSIFVPADTVVDLTTAMNVAAANGTVITKGDQGLPGDVVSTNMTNWTGPVNIPEFPKTYLSTLTGNVTSVALPPAPQPSVSGTITLVVTQDAVGNRTIAWPASVLWPEGIKPQPNASANSVSVFNLLWTGQNWLGLVGGKNFA